MPKRNKPSLSQQWERLTRTRDKHLAALVRTELKLNKLRRAMARRTKKEIKKWDQSPISDDLTDIQLGV